MIQNRKTVKGKLGNTRPKDTDWMGIGNKKKKTEQKKPNPKKVSLGRQISKKKQQMGMGKGKKGLGMLNVMTGQQANQPSKKKTKRVIDSKSPRTGRATRVTKPVRENIGEFKTSKKTKIAEVDSSKRDKYKTKQAIGNRPGPMNTAGKRTTKIEQDRKANISLKRAGGGKVGNKYFTGGTVSPSFGTDYDDR